MRVKAKVADPKLPAVRWKCTFKFEGQTATFCGTLVIHSELVTPVPLAAPCRRPSSTALHIPKLEVLKFLLFNFCFALACNNNSDAQGSRPAL